MFTLLWLNALYPWGYTKMNLQIINVPISKDILHPLYDNKIVDGSNVQMNWTFGNFWIHIETH